MKKKAILSALLVGVMTLGLAACSSSSSKAPETKAPETKAETEAPAGSENSGEETAKGLKICIVSSSGIDDGSFNENCYDGILAFVADHPDCTVTDVKEPDLSKLIGVVEGLVGEYDVFVCPGFNFAAVGEVAQANPDKYFLVVDSTVTDSEGNALAAADLGNVYTMTFQEEQSGFFAGLAAALTTETGKVAVVNGIAFPSNVNYQYGFMSGVNYANAKYGTTAEIVELPSYSGTDVTGANVGGNYVGAFDDIDGGKTIGKTLLEQENVDIIFVAAGASGNGVFAAVKENGSGYCIGCDVDQYDDGANGDSNIILTSGLKVMDLNVTRQLNAIYDGTFVAEDATLGADTDSTGYVSAEGRQQLSEDALAKLAEAYELLKDGTIVPAANFNGYTPTDFPGLN